MKIVSTIILTIVLALAAPLIVLAVSPANAGSTKSSPAQLVCHKTAEGVGGLKKTCYYDCGGWEGGREENVYDHCAAWTLRWRLNRNSQFGPRPRAKSTT
jgi:hypothetical protein